MTKERRLKRDAQRIGLTAREFADGWTLTNGTEVLASGLNFQEVDNLIINEAQAAGAMDINKKWIVEE